MAVEIALTDLREDRINSKSIFLYLNVVIFILSHLLALNTFASFGFFCSFYLVFTFISASYPIFRHLFLEFLTRLLRFLI